MTRTSVLIAQGFWLLCFACGRDKPTESPAESLSESRGDNGFVKYANGKAPLDFIKVVTVTESMGGGDLSLPARLSFNEDRTQRLASPIDGRAVKVLARLGQEVRMGEPLVELSSPNVGQLQADAQKAQSELRLSAQALDRIRKLQADGAVAAKEVAQAESDNRKATSDYERTKVQLAALGITATDPATTVSLRAQIAGTVVERNVLLGQEVRADQATPLLTVSNLDLLWVIGDVYEQDLASVKQGDPVTVRVPAYPGETFNGTLGHVGEVVDPTSHTVKIRCLLSNLDRRLKPDMFAELDVQNRERRKWIYLPSKAVLSDGDRSLVIVATEENTFSLRPVSAGADVAGTVRILNGLLPGEKIVTTGAIFMKREIESQ